MAKRERDPIISPVIEIGNDEIVDLNGHLLRNRIIFLGQRVNDQVAVQTVASLLALNSLSTEEEIKLYINCPAGSSYSVVSILDTMKAVKAPISTVAFGMIGGSGVHILAAGRKGRRFSMPNTRILLQQPLGGAMGSADEVNIQTAELNRTMRMMHRYELWFDVSCAHTIVLLMFIFCILDVDFFLNIPGSLLSRRRRNVIERII